MPADGLATTIVAAASASTRSATRIWASDLGEGCPSGPAGQSGLAGRPGNRPAMLRKRALELRMDETRASSDPGRAASFL